MVYILVYFDYGFSFQGPVEAFCGSITDCQLLGVGSGGSPCHMNNAWCLLTGIQPCLCWRLSYGDHSEHRQRRHRRSEEKQEQRDVQCSWQWNKTTRYLKGQLTQIKMFTNHCNYWFVFRKWDNYTEPSLCGVYKSITFPRNLNSPKRQRRTGWWIWVSICLSKQSLKSVTLDWKLGWQFSKLLVSIIVC